MTARGLWVGVPVPLKRMPVGNPITVMMPEDSHITLVHLGRTADEAKVDEIKKHLTGVWPDEIWIEVTGQGVFWRKNTPTQVALINSVNLFGARAAVVRKLDVWGIDYDKRFGFIPHVTLKPDAIILPNNTSPATLVPPPLLVWGDTKFSL